MLTSVTRGRGEKVEVIFTPHLVPMDRGIFATIYAQPKGPARSKPTCGTLPERSTPAALRPGGRSFACHEGLGVHELLRHHRACCSRADCGAVLPGQSDQGGGRRGGAESNLMLGCAEETALT